MRFEYEMSFRGLSDIIMTSCCQLGCFMINAYIKVVDGCFMFSIIANKIKPDIFSLVATGVNGFMFSIIANKIKPDIFSLVAAALEI